MEPVIASSGVLQKFIGLFFSLRLYSVEQPYKVR